MEAHQEVGRNMEKIKKTDNLIELNSDELIEISGGSLSDFGEWLTDQIATGIHAFYNQRHDSGSRLEHLAHG